jgi:hypothetical protein
MPRPLVLISALAVCLAAQTPAQAPTSPELERIDTLIEQLTALKQEVSSVETRLDALLRTLAEQRGAARAKPAPYNALRSATPADSVADVKPPAVRCAAITAAGTRCTRAAAAGSRYCKQHQVAHQK